MKFRTVMIMMMAVLTICIVAVGCQTQNNGGENKASATTQAGGGNTATTTSQTTFTVDELKKFDGQNGNKAYISVNGKVYDVSNDPRWKGAIHIGKFKAGADYTKEIESSPHGIKQLNGIPVIGTLK